MSGRCPTCGSWRGGRTPAPRDPVDVEAVIVRTVELSRKHVRGARREVDGLTLAVLSRRQLDAILEAIGDPAGASDALASAAAALERIRGRGSVDVAELPSTDGIPPVRGSSWWNELANRRRSEPPRARHRAVTYTDSATCPGCGRTVATLIPKDGDGSASIYIRHEQPDGEICTWSRCEVEADG